jgi:hypothetical protein
MAVISQFTEQVNILINFRISQHLTLGEDFHGLQAFRCVFNSEHILLKCSLDSPLCDTVNCSF